MSELEEESMGVVVVGWIMFIVVVAGNAKVNG